MIAISELSSFKQLYDNPSTIGIEFKVQVELAVLCLNQSSWIYPSIP